MGRSKVGFRPVRRRARWQIVATAFAEALQRLAPFENKPKLAVAVSGGSDSLALALLAKAWASDRDGAVTALIVDHGLRSESASEARKVAGWLRARGIPSRILAWSGPKPVSGIQEAARAARYRLLGDWCRRHGVLHLLVAHQREDQAETVWMRAERGSGITGLAGMASVVEMQGYRLLRPLLGQDRAALRAMLKEQGQPWIDDPSNADPRFERARLRAALGRPGAPRIDSILAHAAVAARARRQADAATDVLLGATVAIHPEGYAEIATEALRQAPPERVASALGRVLTTIGGNAHPPHREKVGRLCQALFSGHGNLGRTLAGCRIIEGGPGRALVVREPAAAAERCDASAGQTILWDGRFRIVLVGGTDRFQIAALGSQKPDRGWGSMVDSAFSRGLPAVIRATLPALYDARGLCEVPHLGWWRGKDRNRGARVANSGFAPLRPLTRPGFNLA